MSKISRHSSKFESTPPENVGIVTGFIIWTFEFIFSSEILLLMLAPSCWTFVRLALRLLPTVYAFVRLNFKLRISRSWACIFSAWSSASIGMLKSTKYWNIFYFFSKMLQSNLGGSDKSSGQNAGILTSQGGLPAKISLLFEQPPLWRARPNARRRIVWERQRWKVRFIRRKTCALQSFTDWKEWAYATEFLPYKCDLNYWVPSWNCLFCLLLFR